MMFFNKTIGKTLDVFWKKQFSKVTKCLEEIFELSKIIVDYVFAARSAVNCGLEGIPAPQSAVNC